MQNRNRLMDMENKLMVTTDKKLGRDKLGIWINLYTLLYKKEITTTKKRPTVYHRNYTQYFLMTYKKK